MVKPVAPHKPDERSKKEKNLGNSPLGCLREMKDIVYKGSNTPKYSQVHIHLHKYTHEEPHTNIHIQKHKHIQIPMHTNACLIYRVPPQSYQPQFDSNPASLRVPKSAALAIPGPLPAPAPHPEQLESAGRYTQA